MVNNCVIDKFLLFYPNFSHLNLEEERRKRELSKNVGY